MIMSLAVQRLSIPQARGRSSDLRSGLEKEIGDKSPEKKVAVTNPLFKNVLLNMPLKSPTLLRGAVLFCDVRKILDRISVLFASSDPIVAYNLPQRSQGFVP